MNLFQYFEKSVRCFPRKRAVGFYQNDRWTYWTYRELHRRVLALCRGLRGLSLKKGDRVAMISRNGPEWPLLELALARIGLVLVPIHLTLSRGQITWILRHCGAKILVLGKGSEEEGASGFFELLQELGPHFSKPFGRLSPHLKYLVFTEGGRHQLGQRMFRLAELLKFDGKTVVPPPKKPIRDHDLFAILYTSGTTGEMKGVRLTHRNLSENALAGPKLTGIFSDDVCLSILPLSHALEQMAGLWVQLIHGCTIVYCRGLAFLKEDLIKIRPTWFAAVPRMLEKVYEGIHAEIKRKAPFALPFFKAGLSLSGAYRRGRKENRALLPLFFLPNILADRVFYRKIREKFGGRVTRIISGGSALDPKVFSFFQAIGIPILEGYGLTEAAPMIAVNPYKKPKMGSVGLPLPKVRVRFGPDREILAKGPNIMAGYEKNPPQTRAVLDQDGWLHTGDQGYLDEEGYLYVRGRLKEMIVTSYGKNIYPGPLEKELEKSPLIHQAMVVGENRPFLSALIVPDPLRRKEIPDTTLRERIGQEVEKASEKQARHERVKGFSLVEEEFSQGNGLMTPTLKLRRAEIEKKYFREIEGLYRG